MIRAFDQFSLPLMRLFDPETAHWLAIRGLQMMPPQLMLRFGNEMYLFVLICAVGYVLL